MGVAAGIYEDPHVGGAVGGEPVGDGFGWAGEQAEVLVEVKTGGESATVTGERDWAVGSTASTASANTTGGQLVGRTN
jgi:hypothetical protein